MKTNRENIVNEPLKAVKKVLFDDMVPRCVKRNRGVIVKRKIVNESFRRVDFEKKVAVSDLTYSR